MNKNDIKVVTPCPVGWLEYKLNSQEMDYVWKCIKNKKEDYKYNLAGNISGSHALLDRGDWFFLNTISPLMVKFNDEFGNLGNRFSINVKHPYHMCSWWVNYQKQHEFNPIHTHTGVYSFVIWMKIPYNSKKQNQKDIARNSNAPLIGNFQLVYQNMLGRNMDYTYHLSTGSEGTMLFFPAELDHLVYPFYDCDEDRISVSGNITLNTLKRL